MSQQGVIDGKPWWKLPLLFTCVVQSGFFDRTTNAVLMYLCKELVERRNYTATISQVDIANHLMVSRGSVSLAVRTLLVHNIIAKNGKSFSLVVDYKQWVLPLKSGKKSRLQLMIEREFAYSYPETPTVVEVVEEVVDEDESSYREALSKMDFA